MRMFKVWWAEKMAQSADQMHEEEFTVAITVPFPNTAFEFR